MIDFGHFALCLAWLLAFTGVMWGSVVASRCQRVWNSKQVETLARATGAIAFLLLLAMSGLAYAFLTNDYSIQYVWQYSNRDMPWIYKITAIWGGMDGSMLLWCFILSLFSAALVKVSGSFPRALRPWTYVFTNSSLLFFLTVTLFLTNPFRYIKAPFIPPDGNGLNPLLQNEYMAIHPPMLYLGFTGLAIPYAICMGALASGYLSNEWVKLTRRWSLVAWSFLTTGIVLGGHWAYIELGWGGFWAWDPVENASFLPWLTATAFLHSIMVQERKGMLKVWNVSLITLSYGLTVFGTFLTRSGVVQSVHSFASTDIGWVFLLYLGLMVVVCVGLIILRWRDLRPDRQIESLLSRETAFLLNNLLLLSICFAVLWGVLFPVISEALTGVKQTVGIPFFNSVTVPLFLALIFMMGVGPLISWRRATVKSVLRIFWLPFVLALCAAVALVWGGIIAFYPVLSYSLCVFVLFSILGELSRGMSTQKSTFSESPVSGVRGLLQLFRRHRTRYGSHIIHLGVVVMVFSITASMAHKVEREFALEPGQSVQIGRFVFQLDSFRELTTKNYEAVQAQTTVKAVGSDTVDVVLHPELRFYTRNKETTTEVALRIGAREDIYLVLAGLDDAGKRAALKVFINPLQMWLWIGAMIMVAGGIFVAIPGGHRAKVAVPNREPSRVTT